MLTSFSGQTLALLVKSSLALMANLYLAKLVSANLGVDSYGVLVVLLGITGMFVFIGEIFSSACVRFLSSNRIHDYYYSQGEVWKSLRQIFTILSFFSALFLWVISAFTSAFNLGSNSSLLAEAGLSLKVLSIYTFFKILSIPLVSLMYARLKILELSIILTLEPLLKILFLTIIFTNSKLGLSTYAWLISAISITLYVIIYYYNKLYTDEFKIVSRRNKTLFYKIMNYTLYNGIGGVAVTMRTNGSTLILNKLLGPEFTAFHGVATSITSVGAQINASLISVLKPRIIKGFNEKNLNLTKGIGSLLIVSNFVIMLLALPIGFFGSEILNFWLIDIPTGYLLIFKVMLFTLLVESGNLVVVSVIQAEGNIKDYQLKVETLMIFAVPIAGLSFLYFNNPNSFYIVLLITSIYSLIPRLRLLNSILFKSNNVSLMSYYKTVLTLLALFIIALLLLSFTKGILINITIFTIVFLLAIIIVKSHIKEIFEIFT